MDYPLVNRRSQKYLCTNCGTCVGICPTNALTMYKNRDSYIPILDSKKCTECGLCVKACPSYTLDLNELNKHIFGKEPEDWFLGNYISCYVGHSTEKKLRYQLASGGIATVLLTFMLEKGMIDGAIVTKMNKKSPLEPEVFIAKSTEEIIAASKSKYCPVHVNTALKYVLDHDEKIAIVGLPCHINGLRKAELFNKKLRKKIIIRIGLFCSNTISFQGTEFLLNRVLHIKVEDILKLDYRGKGWPGGMTIKLKEGTEKFFPLVFYHGYLNLPPFIPSACLFCSDHTNELADISLGDAWLPEFGANNIGESIIIVRTKLGEEILQQVISSGKLETKEIDSNKVLASQEANLYFKKHRLKARISLLRILSREKIGLKTKLFESDIVDYIAAVFTYFNFYISSKRIFRKILLHIPLPFLRIYRIVFGLVNYKGKL